MYSFEYEHKAYSEQRRFQAESSTPGNQVNSTMYAVEGEELKWLRSLEVVVSYIPRWKPMILLRSKADAQACPCGTARSPDSVKYKQVGLFTAEQMMRLMRH